MWFEDLTQCNYFAEFFPTIAIGWLENGKPFVTGETSKEIVERIHTYNKTSGMYYRFLGYHECDFCDYINIELGATTILIFYKEKVYACPALIIHYIEKHQYRPPDEFIEAVLNYNHQLAVEYFKKIRENKFSKRK